MKKSFVAILFFLQLVFVSNAFATNFITPPHTVPYVFGGDTYAWILQAQSDSDNSYVFYCQDTAGAPTVDFNSSTQVYLRFGGGYAWSQEGYCRFAYTSNGGSSWGEMGISGYFVIYYPEHTSFSQFRSNRNVTYNGFPYSGYTNENFGVSGVNQGDVLIQETSFAEGGPAQITVIVEPSSMAGSVVSIPSGVIGCHTNPEIACSAPLSQLASLEAVPNEGWVFGHWEEAENPHSLTPSENKTVIARFYRTFRNAVTEGFRKEMYDATGGQCVNYVRDETDVVDTCTGYAVNCLGQAKKAGYQIGDAPKIGAIAVFSATSILPYGHVGIVKSINGNTITVRESNWCVPATCETVGEHDENLALERIIGYIYETP